MKTTKIKNNTRNKLNNKKSKTTKKNKKTKKNKRSKRLIIQTKHQSGGVREGELIYVNIIHNHKLSQEEKKKISMDKDTEVHNKIDDLLKGKKIIINPNVTMKYIYYLFENLYNNKTITYLEIRVTPHQGSNVWKSLTQQINLLLNSKNTTLTTINLNNNDFSDIFTYTTLKSMPKFKCIDMLANGLKNNNTLEVLYLSKTKLNDECIEKLANALKVNTTLKELYLTNNPSADKGIISNTLNDKDDNFDVVIDQIFKFLGFSTPNIKKIKKVF